MANVNRGQQQHPASAAEISPRWTAGLDRQQPTRIKSFLRQNRNKAARKILLPLIYLFLAVLYFHNLLFRDVGSGLHLIKDNIGTNSGRVSVAVWNSPESDWLMARLEPRSLADITIANAEVAWKRHVDYQNYLRRRAKLKEEERLKREEELRRKKMQKENGTLVDDMAASVNAIEPLILLKPTDFSMSNSTKSSNEDFTERLKNRSVTKTPKRRKMGQAQGGDVGFLPVLVMIITCAIFRVCMPILIGQAANFDPLVDFNGEDDNNADGSPEPEGWGRLSSFMIAGVSGEGDAARLRRRRRADHARRHFQRFVDRLNAERESNGERRIGADTLRHLINSRDFDGDDYDRLSSFVEENGPAVGSIFSAIGATETEINRCPSRELDADDDLLRPRRNLGSQQPQACSVCLEPYQIGEMVRTIPCFHTFHTACIDPWLEQRAECPICKHSAIG